MRGLYDCDTWKLLIAYLVLIHFSGLTRQCLTSPSDPKYQGSLDNKNDDLIVSEGDLFVSSVDIR